MIEIRNVKISLKSSNISLNNASRYLTDSQIAHKIYNNFITFKKDFTFVLFKQSSNSTNHINVSKLKTEKDIEKACDIIKNLFYVDIVFVKIDNIVSTTNLKKELNLTEIITSNLFPNIKYNPEQFPGLFVNLERGSAILFHSGKVVIVGCKTNEDLKWVVREVTAQLVG